MNIRKLISAAAAASLALTGTSALAETITFDGSVTASTSVQVYATLGGTVESVPVKAGDTVSADTALATLRTTKVYAEEDGTISAVFGQAGDSASTIASRYGAVMYLEGTVKYTISASTNQAYSSASTTYVTSGEKVYLRAKSSNDRTGEGLVTSVNGTGYTVEVTAGSFIVGEAVNIYRSSSYKDSTMLGRGNAARAESTAVTAEGTIVNIPVTAGQKVHRGDLLLETLTGTAEALQPAGNTIVAGVSGVIASLSVSEGSTINQDQLAAVIYPEGSMVVEGSIYESDLGSVHVGDEAVVTLAWNEDSGVTYAGTISAISAVSAASTSADSTEAAYTVTVTFTPDEDTRYGMSATVRVGTDEAEEEEEETAGETVEEAAEETTETTEQTQHGDRQFPTDGEMPEGMELPEGAEVPEGMTPPTGTSAE